MESLSPEMFDHWRRTAHVIERDGHGEKVLRLDDGSFLKIFRRKRWLSKSLIWPPAVRFANNAQELERLSIPCPRVKAIYRLDSPYRSLVHYLPLPGDTLRQLFGQVENGAQERLAQDMAAFVRHLHDSGIYFRSLHPGNIVLTPEGQLGLIDISDMRCYRRPLSQAMRRRNLRHLMRYEADWLTPDPDPVRRNDFLSRILRGQS